MDNLNAVSQGGNQGLVNATNKEADKLLNRLDRQSSNGASLEQQAAITEKNVQSLAPLVHVIPNVQTLKKKREVDAPKGESPAGKDAQQPAGGSSHARAGRAFRDANSSGEYADNGRRYTPVEEEC